MIESLARCVFFLLLYAKNGLGNDCTNRCRSGWTKTESGICYQVFRNPKRSYNAAVAFCDRSMSTLLTVPDATEVGLSIQNSGKNVGTCRIDGRQATIRGKQRWVNHDSELISENINALTSNVVSKKSGTLVITPATMVFRGNVKKSATLGIICQYDSEPCTTTPPTTTPPTTTLPSTTLPSTTLPTTTLPTTTLPTTTLPTTTLPTTTLQTKAPVEWQTGSRGHNDHMTATNDGMNMGRDFQAAYNGQIFSPRFGLGPYPRNWKAHYKFDSHESEVLRYTGYYMLDNPNDDGECLDKLQIHSGPSLEHPVEFGPVCGQGSIPDYIVEPGSGGKLVSFTSDDYTENKKSLYFFQSEPLSCGKQVGLTSGECADISSPENVEIMGDDSGCAFIVCAPEDHKVTARFNKQPDTCFYDLSFFDGQSEATRQDIHTTNCVIDVPEEISTVRDRCMTVQLDYKSEGYLASNMDMKVCAVLNELDENETEP